MRSWVIGSSTDCDVVVDSPLASARHCQLTQTPEGFLLNDLGSTNGTYVNGVRIAGPIRLTTGDSITLGRTVPFPWPPELTTSIRIGRLADNDIVLDDPRVSGHHARLIVVAGFQTLIEDIGSSNGTFLNSADRRVTSPTPITGSDTLYFGTLAVPAARLLAGVRKPEPAASVPPTPAALTEHRDARIATLPATATWEEHRWLLAWLAQAPVFAVLIVLIFGRPDGRGELGIGRARQSPPRRSPSRWRRSGWAAPLPSPKSRPDDRRVRRRQIGSSDSWRRSARHLACARSAGGRLLGEWAEGALAGDVGHARR